MKTDHILIIRFSAMGDVAMVVPVVYELALQYPEVRITVLSQPFARPFFEFLAPRVGFMDADLKNEYQGVVGLNTLYRRLTAKNFTAIADFHDVLRTKWLRTRFNIDQYRVEHINKHRMQKRRLTAHKHKVFKQLPSSFDNYADVLSRLGYPIDLGRFHSLFGEVAAADRGEEAFPAVDWRCPFCFPYGQDLSFTFAEGSYRNDDQATSQLSDLSFWGQGAGVENP